MKTSICLVHCQMGQEGGGKDPAEKRWFGFNAAVTNCMVCLKMTEHLEAGLFTRKDNCHLLTQNREKSV